MGLRDLEHSDNYTRESSFCVQCQEARGEVKLQHEVHEYFLIAKSSSE